MEISVGNNDYLERCTSLAIFGGTFDPVHNGHINLASQVLEHFSPQKLLFIPTGAPPHKPEAPITDGNHRYQMLLHALADTPGLEASQMEIMRTGPSYTIDTVRAIKNHLPPEASIYFIIGQDQLQAIDHWKDVAELLQLCQFVAVPRPNYDPADFAHQLEEIRTKYNATIHTLDCPLLDISSSYLRDRLSQGKIPTGLMPQAAINYAFQHNLYNLPKMDMGPEHFEWAKARLEKRLTPKRFRHSLGCVIEAEKLAKHYGADVDKARWAALLHDSAKEYGADKKRALCAAWGITLDPLVETVIDLSHGLLGAESAKRHVHVHDGEVLQAIRYHILGHMDLTLLDKIILLSDFIEPYREDYPPLEEMRRLAYVDINASLKHGLEEMRASDLARGKTLHHWSEDTLITMEKERGN